MADQPDYRRFFLPKSETDIRLIEDPGPALKAVQHTLNRYLQSVYFFEKPHTSYGFVVGAVNDRDRRNILTNARKHLDRPYLYQLDLADFFHFVTEEMVFRVFTDPPLHFSQSLARILTKLTTFEGRLPMGAPTSPVLSNLACRRLDDTLFKYAQIHRWVYTRYSDDFSFSSQQPFTESHCKAICAIIAAEGFEINDLKTRMAGPGDEKIVTGILLSGNGDLKPDYMEGLKTEIRKLGDIVEMQHFYGVHETAWVTKMQQQVQGKIAFAGFVLGKRHPDVLDMRQQYQTAIRPPKEMFGAISWQGFHYLQ